MRPQEQFLIFPRPQNLVKGDIIVVDREEWYIVSDALVEQPMNAPVFGGPQHDERPYIPTT